MVCFYWIKKVLYMLLLNEGIFYGINCLISHVLKYLKFEARWNVISKKNSFQYK